MAQKTEIAPLAVSVRDLTVRYKIRTTGRQQTHPVFGRRVRKSQLVTPISSMTFDVATGEIVGVIGRNGAGKSSLLGAIAGLIPPHKGDVFVSSQPALIGVGAALIPKLPGDTNITIGGLAMGLRPSELDHLREFVREFTELGEALGRPMNTYSSGMRARLAFAIATFKSPEIMLIDEALAVGDKVFRDKSLSRVRELREGASAVIMATHNFNEIRQTCSRVLWLEKGSLQMDGSPKLVIHAYKAFVDRAKSVTADAVGSDDRAGDD